MTKTTEQLDTEKAHHAAALAGLKPEEPIWQALMARFDLAILEANDWATHPDTEEHKRAGWAGRERGLKDLKQELVELQNGEWEPAGAGDRKRESGKVGK